MKSLSVVGEVDLRVAADQAVGREPGQELAYGVGVEVRRLEDPGQLLAGEAGPACCDQLERIPGLGLGIALGEVSAELSKAVE